VADFVLINPPLPPGTQMPNYLPPLGLLSIAAFLLRQGVDATVLDAAALSLDPTRAALKAAESAPLICGLTVPTPALPTAAETAAKLKQLMPDCTIVVGGAHPSARPEEVLDTYRSIDYIAIGEGEVTAWEIHQELERRGEPGAVRGVAFRDGGVIRRSKPRPPIADLDELPLPAWHVLRPTPTEYEPSPQSTYRLPSTILVTSRGDPYADGYRDQSVFGRKLRLHGAARIFEMMEFLYRREAIVDFALMDESLLIDEGRLVELCRLIQRSGLPLSFSCQARPDQSLSAFGWRELAKGGCWQIVFHLAAAEPGMLKRFGARFTVEQALAALKATRAANIGAQVRLLVGGPGETRTTLRATRHFLRRAPLDDVALGYFTPYPGAEIADGLRGLGQIYNGPGARSEWLVNFVPTGFTPQKLRQARRRLYRRFYLRADVMLRYLRRLRQPVARAALLAAAKAFSRRMFRRPST
jgi:radical SAM superfamily enzyme YgiQ (UPF0313 family)